MKAVEFDSSTYPTSGRYCSVPCEVCPTRALSTPTNREVAMATDEVLSTHTNAEVLAADTSQVWSWAIEGYRTATAREFEIDAVVSVEAIYAAVGLIRNGKCPTYELLERN